MMRTVLIPVSLLVASFLYHFPSIKWHGVVRGFNITQPTLYLSALFINTLTQSGGQGVSAAPAKHLHLLL